MACLPVLLANGPLAAAETGAPPVLNPAPTKKDWKALAKLPDFSGTWTAAPEDRGFPVMRKQLPKWLPDAQRQIDAQTAADAAGKPNNIYINCLPEGMPSFILMTVAAFEILSTPGRVTILGEFDGNRLRRIYTDGRSHPEDPDLTFNGHSIGHWEGDTLLVDSVGFLPEVLLPLGQSVGLPNNGDLHIVEKIHLTGPDKLTFDLEITAPHVLAEPWKISRSFVRGRERKFDIIEASCRQGDFTSAIDKDGNHIFTPIDHGEGGAPLAPSR